MVTATSDVIAIGERMWNVTHVNDTTVTIRPNLGRYTKPCFTGSSYGIWLTGYNSNKLICYRYNEAVAYGWTADNSKFTITWPSPGVVSFKPSSGPNANARCNIAGANILCATRPENPPESVYQFKVLTKSEHVHLANASCLILTEADSARSRSSSTPPELLLSMRAWVEVSPALSPQRAPRAWCTA